MTQSNLAVVLAQLGQRDHKKLGEAIAAYREASKELTRQRAPLQWAAIQNNIGTVLLFLGERERGTAKLEEAVVAFREALKERTRDSVPLDWAASLGGEGLALTFIAERRGGVGRAESACGTMNVTFESRRGGSQR